jgi:general secretion pathway protein N
MRTEAWSGPTWLLAAVAGWAMLVWLLAAMGMGSRVGPYRGSDAQSTELPAVPVASPATLQGLEHYSLIAERPVFSTDRLPRAFRLARDAQSAATGDVRLTGVVISPGLQMATLQTPAGASLRLVLDGPEVAGWRLVSLQPRAVVVEGASGKRRLELQTYGERSGQAGPAPAEAGASLPAGTATGDRAADATPRALEPAATTPAQIEALRQRIEARQRQLEQGQAPSPASGEHP